VKVILSERTEYDLLDIGDYIGLDNPRRALSFMDELKRKALGLGDNPWLYQLRPDVGPNVRAAVHGQYVILFEVVDETVMVERIVHGARDLSSLR